MGMIDNPNDPWQEIADLKRRLSELERQAPLGNSSISSGELKILTPENNPSKPGGAITAGGVKMTADDGGKVTAGAAEFTAAEGGKVGAGSTKIHADGSVRNAAGLLVVFSDLMDVRGRVDAMNGVRAPYNGVMTELGGAIKAVGDAAGGRLNTLEPKVSSLEGWKPTVDSAFDSVRARVGSLEGWKITADNAFDDVRGDISTHGTRLGLIDTALSGKASVSSVTTAQSRADSAYSLADGADKRSTLNMNDVSKIIARMNQLIDAHNAKHPDATVPRLT